MRPLPWIAAERYRWTNAPNGYDSQYGDDFGVFEVLTTKTHRTLHIVASCGEGWEHVSVSLPNRCPNWPEMCVIKDLFWLPEEAVMQLHPPKTEYVNCHPYCLHLWRPIEAEIPLPASILVGPDWAKGTAA